MTAKFGFWRYGPVGVMSRASWHTFQVLTERAERMKTPGRDLEWPDNVWAGVSVENREYLQRIDHLRSVPARVRFISFEPLLESLGGIDLAAIDSVIVGGESGPGPGRWNNPGWWKSGNNVSPPAYLLF